jgi:hypothetical protein
MPLLAPVIKAATLQVFDPVALAFGAGCQGGEIRFPGLTLPLARPAMEANLVDEEPG